MNDPTSVNMRRIAASTIDMLRAEWSSDALDVILERACIEAATSIDEALRSLAWDGRHVHSERNRRRVADAREMLQRAAFWQAVAVKVDTARELNLAAEREADARKAVLR